DPEKLLVELIRWNLVVQPLADAMDDEDAGIRFRVLRDHALVRPRRSRRRACSFGWRRRRCRRLRLRWRHGWILRRRGRDDHERSDESEREDTEETGTGLTRHGCLSLMRSRDYCMRREQRAQGRRL